MSDRVIDDRATRLGEYIVENKATVRRAAKQFGVSKSTVHKDVSQRLKYLDSGLYRDVKNVLAVNKAQRHIRGGLATKKKYQALKKGRSASLGQLRLFPAHWALSSRGWGSTATPSRRTSMWRCGSSAAS